MGPWEENYQKIMVILDKKPTISQSKLYALPWEEQTKICYDPATPEHVIMELKYSPDATVRMAAMQRPDVLSGKLLNPFRITLS